MNFFCGNTFLGHGRPQSPETTQVIGVFEFLKNKRAFGKNEGISEVPLLCIAVLFRKLFFQSFKFFNVFVNFLLVLG